MHGGKPQWLTSSLFSQHHTSVKQTTGHPHRKSHRSVFGNAYCHFSISHGALMAAPKFHPTPLPTVDEPTLTHTWPCVCNMQKAMWTQREGMQTQYLLLHHKLRFAPSQARPQETAVCEKQFPFPIHAEQQLFRTLKLIRFTL